MFYITFFLLYLVSGREKILEIVPLFLRIQFDLAGGEDLARRFHGLPGCVQDLAADDLHPIGHFVRVLQFTMILHARKHEEDLGIVVFRRVEDHLLVTCRTRVREIQFCDDRGTALVVLIAKRTTL